MFKYFLLGIFAGFALGITAALLFNVSPRQKAETVLPETVTVTYQDEELKRSLKDLSKAVSEMTESIRTLRPLSTGEASQAGSRNIPAKLDTEEKSGAGKGSTDWAKVIDEGLAKALIENAKTPYDPGVSSLLRNAAKKLRDLREGYDNTLQEWDQRLRSLDKKDPGYEELIKSMIQENRDIEANYIAEKRRIAEEFRLALQSLQ